MGLTVGGNYGKLFGGCNTDTDVKSDLEAAGV